LQRASHFLERVLVEPLRNLDLPLRVLLSAAAAILLAAAAVMISRFAHRIYPSQDAKLNPGAYAVAARELPSPMQARRLLDEGDFRNSVSVLYSWLSFHADAGNIVKRYEWWTNRQFCRMLNERSKDLCNLAQEIIGAYEQIVFGHRAADRAVLELLIEKSSRESAKQR